MEPLQDLADEEPAAPPPARKPRRPFGRAELLRAAAVIPAVWAFLQVAYFWRTNPGLWLGFEGKRGGVLAGLLSTDWSFSLYNTPPLAFLTALLVAAMTGAVGALALRAADIFVRPRIALALGFAVGLGITGIAFELLTMARLLHTPAVWVVWLLLFGALGAIVYRRRRQPVWRWWRRPPEGDERLVVFLDGKHPTRAALSRRVPHPDELYPWVAFERLFWRAGFALIAIMTIGIFWNALFFPESYWDSLILYLGYARMTFLEHAFPFKAVAQVGIGLGANYPHLFSTYGAVASTMFGEWSDLHQRLAAPLAGTLAVVLVYDTALLMWGRRGVAMAAALLFRSVPLGIAYSTYASDYAIAIFFTAAFLYLAALLSRTRLPGVFLFFTFVPAAAMHVNYLMGILWIPWAVAVLLALKARRARRVADEEFVDERDLLATSERRFRPDVSPDNEFDEGEPLEMELRAADTPGLRAVLLSRAFWLALVVCLAVGSTWQVRNWVLTGNPVYAFFPQLFPATINVNEEVLASADLEWFRNGDGVGRLAELIADIEAGRPRRDEYAPGFEREAALAHRLQASWFFWQGYETFRMIEGEAPDRGSWIDRLWWLSQAWRIVWQPNEPVQTLNPWGRELIVMQFRHAYKMQPLVLGFALPGLLIGLAVLLFARTSHFAQMQPHDRGVFVTVFATAIVLAGGLIAYHYCLADYYLYQIIPVIVPLALLAGVLLVAWRSERSLIEKVLEIGSYFMILAVGVVPGVTMSLMNFKVHGGGVAYGKFYDALRLDVFRHPGMDPDVFHRLVYETDVDTWNYLNQELRGAVILTHENRHYVFDPSIELVHLDDWDVQATYSMESAEDRLRFFRGRGIQYYLRVPNEFNHRVNARVGLDELIEGGYLAPVIEDGGNTLYRFRYDRPTTPTAVEATP